MHIQQHNVAIVHLFITLFPENKVTKHLAAWHRLKSSDYKALSFITQSLAQRCSDFKALQISHAKIKAFHALYLFEQLKTKDMKRGMVTKKTSCLILQ